MLGWSDKQAAKFIKLHGKGHDPNVVLQTYASRLLGSSPDLVLYGGGNTSVKVTVSNLLGERLEALFIKPSGLHMASMTPQDFMALDQGYLRKLRKLKSLPETAMAEEFRAHMLMGHEGLPSVETLLHAFLEKKFIDHTHPAAILALTNRVGGEKTVREALGKEIAVVPYQTAGFALAVAVAKAIEQHPDCAGAVLMHHGLITWDNTARGAYEKTAELADKASRYLAKKRSRTMAVKSSTSVKEAKVRYARVAPALRGLLAIPSGNPDNPFHRVILHALINEEVLRTLDSETGRELTQSAPLTPDYLIRTKSYPLFVSNPRWKDANALKRQLTRAVQSYATRYRTYFKRYAKKQGHVPNLLLNSVRVPAFSLPAMQDTLPKVVLLPGLGAVCAGMDIDQATLAANITQQMLSAKKSIHESGGKYCGLTADHLFEMEFHGFQRAKLAKTPARALGGSIALVTGAAGAIGSAISQALLKEGCHVALTDLPGKALDAVSRELSCAYGDRVAGIALDVSNANSVARGFEKVVELWGGIDLIVVNAGLAHVSSLEDMDVESFRRLERVNVEGTLLVLSEAARRFKHQNTGGDIVVISTKNVFAPGAQFGAYSATKAASHQLARIASLELAAMGVRVNMVAPDGVFSHGDKKSGLWAAVGPSRMRARGLDEKGLEEYYRQRNLLKTKITAEHVARAVLFFATRQTPTTGATLPVDGGLPDATPR